MAVAATLTDEAQHHYTQEEIEHMETQELLELYKRTGDQDLKWPLVMRYEKLIKSVALQVRGVYSSFAQVEDIIDEGILTLLTAIDKYDPDKGVKFETYVAKRIRGMVVDLARKQDWLPRNIRQRAREIDQAVTNLGNDLGRSPTEEEVADYLGVPLEKYQKDTANVSLSNILSLDALMDAGNAEGYRLEIASEPGDGQPEVVFQERELQSVLAEGVRQLRKNEQVVLSLYYEKNLPMKEIAHVMDVSKPRVSQIHARALQKLRTHMEAYMRENEPDQMDSGEKKGAKHV
jgi:RNA polymerase sigma factor for flagellar operon FliA